MPFPNLPMPAEHRLAHTECHPPPLWNSSQPTLLTSPLEVICLNPFLGLATSKQIYHVPSMPYSCMFVQSTSLRFSCPKFSSYPCPLNKLLLILPGQRYPHNCYLPNCAWSFSPRKQRLICTR